MKPLSVQQQVLWIPACMLLCAGMLSARLSEPSVTYYGTATGGDGIALTNGEALVIARFQNVECTRTYTGEYNADDVNYSLRIPIDNGIDYRYEPYALREGELPEIVVVLDGIEWQIENPVPPAGPPASLQRADIRAVPEPGLLYCIIAAVFWMSLSGKGRKW
jgi:hypothetical protein